MMVKFTLSGVVGCLVLGYFTGILLALMFGVIPNATCAGNGFCSGDGYLLPLFVLVPCFLLSVLVDARRAERARNS